MSDAILPETPTILYPTQQTAVDSAALYEAVNAWIEALVAHLEPDPVQPGRVYNAHQDVISAAHNLAQTRYDQRRAQQTEGQP